MDLERGSSLLNLLMKYFRKYQGKSWQFSLLLCTYTFGNQLESKISQCPTPTEAFISVSDTLELLAKVQQGLVIFPRYTCFTCSDFFWGDFYFWNSFVCTINKVESTPVTWKTLVQDLIEFRDCEFSQSISYLPGVEKNGK